MGAWLSRAWNEVVQFIRQYQNVRAGYGSPNARQNFGEDEPFMHGNMETSDNARNELSEGSDGSTLRRRVFATSPENIGERPPENEVEISSEKEDMASAENAPQTSLGNEGQRSPERERSPRLESTSPLKSNWNENSEHPKPKLDIAPPNKKSKTESGEGSSKTSEKTKFVPNSAPYTSFGDMEEHFSAEQLSPDYVLATESTKFENDSQGIAQSQSNNREALQRMNLSQTDMPGSSSTQEMQKLTDDSRMDQEESQSEDVSGQQDEKMTEMDSANLGGESPKIVDNVDQSDMASSDNNRHEEGESGNVVEIVDAEISMKTDTTQPLGVKAYLTEASDIDTDESAEQRVSDNTMEVRPESSDKKDDRKPCEIVATGQTESENLDASNDTHEIDVKSEMEISERNAAEALMEIGKNIESTANDAAENLASGPNDLSTDPQSMVGNYQIPNEEGNAKGGDSVINAQDSNNHGEEMGVEKSKETPPSVEASAEMKLVDYPMEDGEMIDQENVEETDETNQEEQPLSVNQEQIIQEASTGGIGEQERPILAEKDISKLTLGVALVPQSSSAIEENSSKQPLDVSEVQNGDMISENAENIDPNIQPKVKSKTRQVSVQWTGHAKEVSVTGSWLNWTERINLQRSDENLWSVNLDLDENLKHIEMKFVVDGEWLISPDIPSIDDGFGNRNNCIRLVH